MRNLGERHTIHSQTKRRFVVWGLYLLAGSNILGLFGCVGSRPIEHPLIVEWAGDRQVLEKEWQKKVAGRITDLAVASESKRFVIANVPDSDRKVNPRRPQIMMFDSNAKNLWQRFAGSSIRNLTISPQGDRVVMTTYDEKVTSIDGSGKVVWEYRTLCRPLILDRIKKVLCYFDDDSAPSIAFTTLSYEGKLETTYKIKREILALKTSANQEYVALGLTGGNFHLVQLTDKTHKTVFKKPVEAEIVDVAVSSDAEPRAAVIFIARSSGAGGQRLGVLNSKGEWIERVDLPIHVHRVEFSPDNKKIMLYGNSPQGQHLSTVNSETLEGQWKYHTRRFADYSMSAVILDNGIFAGFENGLENTELGRESQIYGFGWNGQVQWSLPVETEIGAYLFGFSRNPKNQKEGMLIVSTDDAKIKGYEVEL